VRERHVTAPRIHERLEVGVTASLAGAAGEVTRTYSARSVVLGVGRLMLDGYNLPRACLSGAR
jgi:hypothetical protein